MPQNCNAVTLKDVVVFFVEKIDGMGLHDGFLRNLGVPASLENKSWKFCELTKEEFFSLIIPDGTFTLIKDKDENSLDSIVNVNVKERLKILESGGELPALIIREKLSGESNDASFYIEDGAKRAISLKAFFRNNPYKPVKAYIGSFPLTA